MKFHEVTRNEVHNALFTMAPTKAPGITGMTGKAYHSVWTLLEDGIYNLVCLCTKTGYHPKEW